MSISDWLAVAGVLTVLGGLIARMEMMREEIRRLREWRHSVGEKPGYAAFERLTKTNERLDRYRLRMIALQERLDQLEKKD